MAWLRRRPIRRSVRPSPDRRSTADEIMSGLSGPAWETTPGPTTDEPVADVTPPVSGDRRYTYTYDVPWDAVHRFPPAITPSGRPYVSECPTQIQTVPGRDGQARTVNIVRCY